MNLSGIGEIVREEVLHTPEVRPNVRLDEWIIMPNHVHMIIRIADSSAVETPRRGVSTWKPGSLGAIMNQFKSVCTKRILASYPDSGFAWQSRFHDHIIRNEESLRLIREYIRKNPARWQFDEENPENRQ
jgi:REP element-mobilizing transposase RayT